MEEEKAAAYYDELTRKGSGAARFKHGLGFSSSDTQLQSIRNKLKSKSSPSPSPSPDRDRHRNHKPVSRSRSRDRDRSRDKDSRRRRSRSREKHTSRSRRISRERRSHKNGGLDYSKLIQGYHKMAPAERVKAKMKLQLSETAKKDPTRGTGSGWERFDFDKDATLDDEEIEVAEDDSSLVKHIGQSFRFSAVEAKKEDQIKAAHDEAMFGAPSLQFTSEIDEEKEDSPKCTSDSAPDTSLISNQVISMQQVSWRDRVKKM